MCSYMYDILNVLTYVKLLYTILYIRISDTDTVHVHSLQVRV